MSVHKHSFELYLQSALTGWAWSIPPFVFSGKKTRKRFVHGFIAYAFCETCLTHSSATGDPDRAEPEAARPS